MRDVHFLELAIQAGLDLKKDIHLLFVIEEFVRQKEKHHDPWSFRIKSDGGKYWVNHKEMIASFNYPYINELLVAIDNHRKNFKIDGLDVSLKEFNPLHVLMELSSNPEVFKACRAKCVRVALGNPAYGNLPSHAVIEPQG